MRPFSPAFGFRRMLADPRWVVVAAVLVGVVMLVWLLGEVLLPLLIALVLAYFLDGGVELLCRHRCNRSIGVAVIYTLFLVAYVVAILGPLQLAVRQTLRLLQAFPALVNELRHLLTDVQLPPFLDWVAPPSEGGLAELLATNVRQYGDQALGQALGAVTGATSWAFYLFLIPLLVLFFLNDKESVRGFVLRLLPRDMELLTKIWAEMELRMANYIRGKVWEILIVGIVTWVVFFLLGFQYAAVTSILAGVSVIIPYIGALAVTVPIFLLGLLQWGPGWPLVWLLVAYIVIQFLDGNVLVPLMFSEAVKLTPTVILVSIMIFGAVWGLWGVFFAIPLATLIKTLAATYIDYRENGGLDDFAEDKAPPAEPPSGEAQPAGGKPEEPQPNADATAGAGGTL